MINVLLIGGRGNIGAGLRTYLPRIDDKYDVTSIDLPGSADKAGDKVPGDLIDLDINEHPEQLAQLMQGRDIVVYLARRSPLAAMNTMTDLVFEALSQQSPMPLMVASSSVHAASDPSSASVTHAPIRAGLAFTAASSPRRASPPRPWWPSRSPR